MSESAFTHSATFAPALFRRTHADVLDLDHGVDAVGLRLAISMMDLTTLGGERH